MRDMTSTHRTVARLDFFMLLQCGMWAFDTIHLGWKFEAGRAVEKMSGASSLSYVTYLQPKFAINEAVPHFRGMYEGATWKLFFVVPVFIWIYVSCVWLAVAVLQTKIADLNIDEDTDLYGPAMTALKGGDVTSFVHSSLFRLVSLINQLAGMTNVDELRWNTVKSVIFGTGERENKFGGAYEEALAEHICQQAGQPWVAAATLETDDLVTCMRALGPVPHNMA